jgi:hypothetical protein
VAPNVREIKQSAPIQPPLPPPTPQSHEYAPGDALYDYIHSLDAESSTYVEYLVSQMQDEGWYNLPFTTYSIEGVSQFIMEMLRYLQFWQNKYGTLYTGPVSTVDGGTLTLKVIWELGKQDAI